MEELPDNDDADGNTTKAAMMPCTVEIRKYFVNRWGDRSDILAYTEGIRRKPRGIKSVKVLATTLDLRKANEMYGIGNEDKSEV